jgi:hypothetical protein
VRGVKSWDSEDVLGDAVDAVVHAGFATHAAVARQTERERHLRLYGGLVAGPHDAYRNAAGAAAASTTVAAWTSITAITRVGWVDRISRASALLLSNLSEVSIPAMSSRAGYKICFVEHKLGTNCQQGNRCAATKALGRAVAAASAAPAASSVAGGIKACTSASPLPGQPSVTVGACSWLPPR